MITPELIKQAIQETREFGEAKCVRDRHGSKVCIYADGMGGRFPVHGATWLEQQKLWDSTVWTRGGKYHINDESNYDLVPAARQKTVRVYWDADDSLHVGEGNYATGKPLKLGGVACALVTLTEGEFE